MDCRASLAMIQLLHDLIPHSVIGHNPHFFNNPFGAGYKKSGGWDLHSVGFNLLCSHLSPYFCPSRNMDFHYLQYDSGPAVFLNS